MQTKARVQRINHDGRRVVGVALADGSEIEADIVVMNGDASTTCALLEKGGNEQRGRERSLSGVVLLAGLRKQIPNLSHHTVYFSANYGHEFEQLFDHRQFPEDPTVYVSAPSRSDPTVSPKGGETLFIMANAPPTAESWTQEQTRIARERLVNRLLKSGFPEFDSETVVSDMWTPRRIADDYLMPGGAIYGDCSHGWKQTFLRPRNRDTKFSGLFHVGGSAHPGGGTPTVLLSAEITCHLIRRYHS
jgi:diapolycopene oxygenase